MSAATLLSVQDYLDFESLSPIKNEYVDGLLYPLSDSSNRHNRLASNTLGTLHGQLRGKSCQPYNSDTKIRVRLPNQVRFYYADVSVICRPNADNESFQDEPATVIEVLSTSTRRIDEGEKKDAYLTIPSLNYYLLIEQDIPSVVVFRRTPQGFVRDVYEKLSDIIPLAEIEAELSLVEIYRGVQFSPEPDGE